MPHSDHEPLSPDNTITVEPTRTLRRHSDQAQDNTATGWPDSLRDRDKLKRKSYIESSDESEYTPTTKRKTGRAKLKRHISPEYYQDVDYSAAEEALREKLQGKKPTPLANTSSGGLFSPKKRTGSITSVNSISPAKRQALSNIKGSLSSQGNRKASVTSFASSEEQMAPSYRNRDRRQNRAGVVDHDIFEGLPVRQWRRDHVTVAPPPTQDSTTSQNDIWAIELPHGMPKDSHLLPQHSQDLLRAARSGRIYKRPAPVEEEDVDAEPIPGDKPEKKEDDPKDKGFTAKAWKPVPRHVEVNDNEYLAKRRKGLVPMKAPPAPVVATLTKTTVKRIDAAGNEYVQDVVVPHGQVVEGEVIAQTEIPDPNALAVGQPTPSKRKSSSKKKKASGPGRGRKKKIPTAPTSAPLPVPVEGVAESAALVEGAVATDVVKTEVDTSANAAVAIGEDTEMGDGSLANSEDEDGDDGDDGDEGEDEEGSDAQSLPSKAARAPPPDPGALPAIKSIPNLGTPDTVMGGTEIASPMRAIPDRERFETKSGSPLKTVALTASTLASPMISPTFQADPSATVQQSPTVEAVPPTIPTSLDTSMSKEAEQSAPPILPPPPPEPTQKEVEAAVVTRREEEEEEEMLLDIVEQTESAPIVDPEAKLAAEPPAILPPRVSKSPVLETSTEIKNGEPIAELVIEEKRVEEVPVPAATEEMKPEDPPQSPATEVAPEIKEETVPPVVEPTPEADDDDDFDLLGGLEKSLGKQ